MPSRAPLAAVFDLDGTLIDSLPVTFDAFRDATAPFLGRRLSDAEIYAHFGPADHLIVAALVGPAHAEAAVAELMAVYARRMAEMPLFPGIADALAAIRAAGVRLALCTGRGGPSTRLILAALGLSDTFEAVVVGEDVAHPKPAPDGIRETARRLAVPAERTVYVGDSLKDVEAGLAAGAFTIAALWAATEGEAPAGGNPSAVARRPDELPGLVAALHGR